MRQKATKGPLPLAPLPAPALSTTATPALPPEEIVYPEIAPEPSHASEAGIFDDLEDDATRMMVVTPPLDDIPPLDTGLTLDEKQEFIRLLNLHLPPEKRAAQLAKLAMFTDQKRAGVGLRALIEINNLTGMNRESATEIAPMFQLPEGTKVSVLVQKVEK